jgi:sugar lactone lactonase YvrE
VHTRHRRAAAAGALAVAVIASAGALAATGSFLGPLHTFTKVASAVPRSGPARGDVNPYGVVVVPRTVGRLVRGDVLVSNFNNRANEQGTGSSIVEISPSGRQRVFAVVPRITGMPAVGLTTALAVLHNGDVLVGSLPAPGGKGANAKSGGLVILNPAGHATGSVTGSSVNGPWDMTVVSRGNTDTVFVSNVLNGTVAAHGHVVRRGTVTRLVFSTTHGHMALKSGMPIASGFAEHIDPNALVVGPTGLGMGRGGVLYVADSNDNRIAAVPNAMTRLLPIAGGGRTVARGGPLNDPLGLTIAPNGHILTANGGDGRVVETTPAGAHPAVRNVIPNGGGDLFGLAVAPNRKSLYLVDDNGSGPSANSLGLLH